MNATITRAAVTAIAGLAIIGDAFLLFVKPHQMQGQSAASGATLGASVSPDDSVGSSPDTNSGSVGSNNSNNSGTATSTLADGTYTSVASPNEYGEVQLQVTVKGGKITAINAVSYPNHTDRSQAISAQAIPELADRAISAQSSDIQFVSGATETSTAFANSLQDAINQALNQR
ncbi:FMN-binding domain-containing protein [Bifidobacterium margollesii]|uniref:FMN-binding domain-containing protein n=1 Tax=Bifidobacterium margollesii TaxID=2020964 RepID=A0A2N5J7M8_9BIFI|nr:FMN-binding protein [Bifidobacterium margollesii]PLS30215.1 FMN-binding domain-containing protein [Bifidobacterium margollesii]